MKNPVEIRKEILRALVERDGLTTVAKAANKPASQINDMLAGRKTFGDKVGRAMAISMKLSPYYFEGVDSKQSQPTSVPTSKSPLEDLLTSDAEQGLIDGLVKCFKGSTLDDKELLLMIANKMYERNNPEDGWAKPRKHRRRTDIVTKLKPSKRLAVKN